MTAIFLSNDDKTLQVEVVPAHGGMIAQIYLKEKELLHLDRTQMQTAPMAAGGIPILFPFSSKTADDTYKLGERTFYMPMHGLVKNDVFAVETVEKNRVVLWLENSSSWKEQYFPFDFRLEIEYEVHENCLDTIFRITNKAEEAMPHYLGWHPYFKATDKKQMSLKQDMQVHYDYGEHVDRPMCEITDLSLNWDDVFHSPAVGGFELFNEADGYKVRCETDKEFDAMVLCSWVEESMCVEPWCGLPNSINTGRFLKWIEPGESREYKVRLILESL